MHGGAAQRVLARWAARSIEDYRSLPAAGIMPFTVESYGAYFSGARVETMGPWGDLYAQGKAVFDIPIDRSTILPAGSGLPAAFSLRIWAAWCSISGSNSLPR